MIVYFDLVAACFLNQSGALNAAELQGALRTLDARPGWEGGLLAHLQAHARVSAPQLSQVAGWTRRYQERYRQALCLRLLEREGCPQQVIHQLVAALDDAPFGADLAHVLRAHSTRSEQAIAELLQRVESRLRSYGARVLSFARREDYATVSRRLVPRALIDERALRLSVLFRSERTSWLLKSQGLGGEDAEAPFPEEDGAFEFFGLEVGHALGPYTIRAPLGEGGMGRIYLATGPDGSFVAIKTLRTELAEAEDFARFEREAKILARLEHRSVLPLLDEGTSAFGVRYLVFPAVEGETLSQALLRTPRLSLSDCFAIADELLSALEAIHAAGVVHKDLKPENIMLRDRAEPSPLCVIDFGLAHLRGDDRSEPEQFRTRQSDLLGTPSYLSPEQVTGSGLSFRSDLYAFGVLLFRMLTGKLPFTCKTPYEMLAAHAHALPETLFSAAPSTAWDPHLQALLTRLLSKDPGSRPRSARAVREELNACAVRMRGASVPPAKWPVRAVRANAPDRGVSA